MIAAPRPVQAEGGMVKGQRDPRSVVPRVGRPGQQQPRPQQEAIAGSKTELLVDGITARLGGMIDALVEQKTAERTPQRVCDPLLGTWVVGKRYAENDEVPGAWFWKRKDGTRSSLPLDWACGRVVGVCGPDGKWRVSDPTVLQHASPDCVHEGQSLLVQQDGDREGTVVGAHPDAVIWVTTTDGTADAALAGELSTPKPDPKAEKAAAPTDGGFGSNLFTWQSAIDAWTHGQYARKDPV